MKKIFVAVAFLCGIILTATTASAEQWVSFVSDNFGDEVLLDVDSVTLEQNEDGVLIFNANFKTVFTDEGRKAAEQETLAEVVSVCSFAERGHARLASTLTSTFYALDGSVIHKEETPSNWLAVKSDSMLGLMYETARQYLKL